MIAAGDRLGPYEITSPLGAGGMGEVWQARDKRLEREVALKLLPSDLILDAERRACLEREAKVLGSLNHPNIATLHALEELDGQHLLVMELVEGEGLEERIARGPIPLEETVGIALQIALALEAAHERGIVHRDLKPANVKIRPDGTVKVLDFGLAKAWEAEGGEAGLSLSPTITTHHTQAGVLLGTAGYMAPEQARGKPVGGRADIWAFGVVLFEMLTGRRLFDGETVTDVIAAVVTREPDWDALPQGTPAALRRVLARCLRKDPRTRQPDIASVRLELAELAMTGDEHEASPAAPAMLPALPRGGRMPTAAWFAVGAACLLAGAAAAWVLRPGAPPPRVVEFEVQPPEGTTFYLDPERPGAAVVSPDGSTIAFTAEVDGEFALYLRPLASTTAQAVPGTEGAQYPFWSPDSRWVGFFSNHKVKKVQVVGGGAPPVTVCDAEEMKGASWGRSGVIVFAPDAISPLERVAESGGTPAQVTEIDASRNEDSHRHPRFLPDGRHFLYLARVNGGSEDNGVMVGSVDGGPGRLLLRSPAAAEYASGHLLFVRDGTLMAQPFDPEKLELQGEPRPVADDLRLVAAATALAVYSASSNGVLLYQTGGVAAARKLAWRDREGREAGTLGDEATYWDVALSPAGDQAAVNISGSSGSADVWLYDIARAVRTRLTFDPRDEWGLVWSPDGAALAFASDRRGHYDLYRIAVGGTQPEELLYESENPKLPTSFSPDGRLLMFAEQNSGAEGWDVLVLPLDGQHAPEPFLTGDFDQTTGVFSPDGRWVAYCSNESGHNEIYVQPYPGPGRKWQVSTSGGSWPLWRSDGREIFYRAPNGGIEATPIDARGDTLSLGTPKTLFPLSTPESTNMRYSPVADGGRFLLIEPVAAQVSRPLAVVLDWTARLAG